jgi:predicted nucleic acid-binding protein
MTETKIQSLWKIGKLIIPAYLQAGVIIPEPVRSRFGNWDLVIEIHLLFPLTIFNKKNISSFFSQ